MSFEEFKRLVKGMKAVYTSQSFLPYANSVKIWYELLKDMTYEIANVSIQKHMATNKFPPTVAEIRSGAAEITSKHRDWSDGWECFRKAVGRFGYYRREEAFASMDEITRKVVKRLGWKELCMSENIMQDRANFRMVYEQEQSKAKEMLALPESLKRNLARLQEKSHRKEIEGVQRLVESDDE